MLQNSFILTYLETLLLDWGLKRLQWRWPYSCWWYNRPVQNPISCLSWSHSWSYSSGLPSADQTNSCWQWRCWGSFAYNDELKNNNARKFRNVVIFFVDWYYLVHPHQPYLVTRHGIWPYIFLHAINLNLKESRSYLPIQNLPIKNS